MLAYTIMTILFAVHCPKQVVFYPSYWGVKNGVYFETALSMGSPGAKEFSNSSAVHTTTEIPFGGWSC